MRAGGIGPGRSVPPAAANRQTEVGESANFIPLLGAPHDRPPGPTPCRGWNSSPSDAMELPLHRAAAFPSTKCNPEAGGIPVRASMTDPKARVSPTDHRPLETLLELQG